MKSKISTTIVGVCLSAYIFGQSPDLGTKKDTVVSGGMVTDANALSGKMLAPAAVRQQQAAVRNGVTIRSGRETDLGEGMYLWDSAADPASALLEVTVDNDSWNNLIARSTFYNGLQSVSALLYTKFNDDFDFIFFVLNTSNEGTILTDLGFYGINMNAGNDVQGLGLGVYNDASSWGSAGKLYRNAWSYRNDPREYARRIAGTYATSPDYAKTLVAVIDTVEKRLNLDLLDLKD
jgi:hypothetical protein